MADNQQTGRVIRCLPGQRVVVQIRDKQITATAQGVGPRPGAEVLIINLGRGWEVLSWQ